MRKVPRHHSLLALLLLIITRQNTWKQAHNNLHQHCEKKKLFFLTESCSAEQLISVANTMTPQRQTKSPSLVNVKAVKLVTKPH